MSGLPPAMPVPAGAMSLARRRQVMFTETQCVPESFELQMGGQVVVCVLSGPSQSFIFRAEGPEEEAEPPTPLCPVGESLPAWSPPALGLYSIQSTIFPRLRAHFRVGPAVSRGLALSKGAPGPNLLPATPACTPDSMRGKAVDDAISFPLARPAKSPSSGASPLLGVSRRPAPAAAAAAPASSPAARAAAAAAAAAKERFSLRGVRNDTAYEEADDAAYWDVDEHPSLAGLRQRRPSTAPQQRPPVADAARTAEHRRMQERMWQLDDELDELDELEAAKLVDVFAAGSARTSPGSARVQRQDLRPPPPPLRLCPRCDREFTAAVNSQRCAASHASGRTARTAKRHQVVVDTARAVRFWDALDDAGKVAVFDVSQEQRGAELVQALRAAMASLPSAQHPASNDKIVRKTGALLAGDPATAQGLLCKQSGVKLMEWLNSTCEGTLPFSSALPPSDHLHGAGEFGGFEASAALGAFVWHRLLVAQQQQAEQQCAELELEEESQKTKRTAQQEAGKGKKQKKKKKGATAAAASTEHSARASTAGSEMGDAQPAAGEDSAGALHAGGAPSAEAEAGPLSSPEVDARSYAERATSRFSILMAADQQETSPVKAAPKMQDQESAAAAAAAALEVLAAVADDTADAGQELSTAAAIAAVERAAAEEVPSAAAPAPRPKLTSIAVTRAGSQGERQRRGGSAAAAPASSSSSGTATPTAAALLSAVEAAKGGEPAACSHQSSTPAAAAAGKPARQSRVAALAAGSGQQGGDSRQEQASSTPRSRGQRKSHASASPADVAAAADDGSPTSQADGPAAGNVASQGGASGPPGAASAAANRGRVPAAAPWLPPAKQQQREAKQLAQKQPSRLQHVGQQKQQQAPVPAHVVPPAEQQQAPALAAAKQLPEAAPTSVQQGAGGSPAAPVMAPPAPFPLPTPQPQPPQQQEQQQQHAEAPASVRVPSEAAPAEIPAVGFVELAIGVPVPMAATGNPPMQPLMVFGMPPPSPHIMHAQHPHHPSEGAMGPPMHHHPGIIMYGAPHGHMMMHPPYGPPPHHLMYPTLPPPPHTLSPHPPPATAAPTIALGGKAAPVPPKWRALPPGSTILQALDPPYAKPSRFLSMLHASLCEAHGGRPLPERIVPPPSGQPRFDAAAAAAALTARTAELMQQRQARVGQLTQGRQGKRGERGPSWGGPGAGARALSRASSDASSVDGRSGSPASGDTDEGERRSKRKGPRHGRTSRPGASRLRPGQQGGEAAAPEGALPPAAVPSRAQGRAQESSTFVPLYRAPNPPSHDSWKIQACPY